MTRLNLTKNEKKVLLMLLDNSKVTDSEIGQKLNISSQAVGKIRRKLENSIIRSYSVELDYSRLGIHTFTIAIARMTKDGLNLGELEIESKLLSIPNIVNVYRLPRGSSTHVIVYGFTDINEMDEYFHSASMKDELHHYLEIKELFTFSHNSLIKNSPADLFRKVVNGMGAEPQKKFFDEIERFKRRL